MDSLPTLRRKQRCIGATMQIYLEKILQTYPSKTKPIPPRKLPSHLIVRVTPFKTRSVSGR